MTSKKEFIYNISDVVRVIDGDTIEATLDMGFSIYHKVHVRIANIDTPEKRTTEGKLVKTFVEKWFSSGNFVVNSLQLDKYGRVLGSVSKISENPSVDLANLLVKNGFAKLYDGKTKIVWTDEELLAITNKLTQ